MSKLDDLSAWRMFCSLCKTRNFSDTAAEFDVEVSTVSRAVSSLETALGQDLIKRNMRPLQLTEVGSAAYESAIHVIRLHQEMIAELTQRSAQIDGKIRLSLAPGFVTRYMMPMLMEFNSMYPEISFDIVGGGNLADVLQYKADIAVVSFKPTDSRLISFSRGRNVYVPVASPQYIEKYGMPQHPSELSQHTVLLYDGTVRHATKTLSNGEEETEIKWQKVVRVGNILAIKRSVLDGLGIAVDLPLLHCAQEIASGQLIPILPGWYHPPVECFIVTTKSNWRMRRHRIFLQWFQPRLQTFFREQEELVAPFWRLPTKTLVKEL